MKLTFLILILAYSSVIDWIVQQSLIDQKQTKQTLSLIEYATKSLDFLQEYTKESNEWGGTFRWDMLYNIRIF